MIPYARHTITQEDIDAVTAVLRGDWLTTGPMVPRFEEAVAEFVGARYAVAVSSGTAALEVVFRALRVESGQLDVAVPALSFVATANGPALAGHRVQVVDVDPVTGKMRDSGCSIRVPVHYAGDASWPWTWARDSVVEDACHAFGAYYENGKRVGSCCYSRACVFSFHPVKPLTTCEGGMITTNDSILADTMRAIRDNGRIAGVTHMLGGNYRMSDVAAALGLSQLKAVNGRQAERLRLAFEYKDHMGKMPAVTLPETQGYPSWHLFPVRFRDRPTRDAVRAALEREGIGTQVHYNPPINRHPYWRSRLQAEGTWDACPNALSWADTELSLPLWAGMPEWVPCKVARVIERVLEC